MNNFPKMTGIILAGGLGTRLRSVVSDRPKVLARVCNRPFITFLFDQLLAACIKEVILCTGFKADEVQQEFGNCYQSLSIVHSAEPQPLGTGGAVRHALPLIKSDTVLIMNGDSFVNINLTVYMEWFLQCDRQASLLLVNVPDTRRYGKVIADKDGLIMAFEEKSLSAGPGWINAGIYIIKKNLLRSIPAAMPYSLERQFFPELTTNKIFGFYAYDNFIDIGTPESYGRAQSFFYGDNRSSSKGRINASLEDQNS
jgi:NDP-sugar pyrophosphorylase family protein